MGKLVFVVAVAAAAPLENTPEVATAYLDDVEDVAAAKAAFTAAFDDAATGGLAAKQAPAPLAVAAAPALALAHPTVPVGAYAAYPYAAAAYAGYPYAAAAYPGVYANTLGYHGLPYAGLPIVA